MAKLIIHHEKIENINTLIELCPFGALEEQNGRIEVNAACKMCRLCERKGPAGAVTFEEAYASVSAVNKSEWNGIAVYVDYTNGKIHPVTLELLGKARELADKIHHPVYALFLGNHIEQACHELLHYQADKVFAYDEKELERFTMEAYANVFEKFINEVKPSAILVGATTVGRQLAPRIAARMRTGLTADCTLLDMKDNTDLIQIRPAFGGNIMAQICTPDHRPQMATVRYKVMNAPPRQKEESGDIIFCHINKKQLKGHAEVLDIIPKAKERSIDSSDILIVAGRGIKKKEDLDMLEELAALLGGQVACTRPLVEAGWVDARQQIGLSGRTVRPRLIITCGVSGAIQFAAGMNHSECIIAINSDDKSNMFQTAHYCLVGDLYEIIPKLTGKLKNVLLTACEGQV
jgi:electron transfer flavoprotein alpha subunit